MELLTDSGPVWGIVDVAGILMPVFGPSLFKMEVNRNRTYEMLAPVRNQDESLIFLKSTAPVVCQYLR